MNAEFHGVSTLLNSQIAVAAGVNIEATYLLWYLRVLFMMWQCICILVLSRISVKYPLLEFLRHEITQLNRIWVSVNIVLKREQPIYLKNSRMLICVHSLNLFLATSFSVCRIDAFCCCYFSNAPPHFPSLSALPSHSLVFQITGSVYQTGQVDAGK